MYGSWTLRTNHCLKHGNGNECQDHSSKELSHCLTHTHTHYDLKTPLDLAELLSISTKQPSNQEGCLCLRRCWDQKQLMCGVFIETLKGGD